MNDIFGFISIEGCLLRSPDALTLLTDATVTPDTRVNTGSTPAASDLDTLADRFIYVMHME